MSQSKEEQLDIIDEVRLLINELRSLKNTQFHKLKQPKFGEIVFNGLVKKFSPFSSANNFLNSLIPTERPDQKSDLEVDEANGLWQELRKIFSQLELDINSIASLPEKDRLPKQKAIFTEALKQIGPKFARAIEIDTDIKSFEYSKSDSYGAMQSIAQKKMTSIKQKLKGEFRTHSLHQKWQEAAEIISKEFPKELPTTQDYVNLLNALHQLEEMEKIPLNMTPQPDKVEKVIPRKKKIKIGNIVEGVHDETNFLSELNASLISTILSHLEIIRLLETTKWKELSLESLPQNKAITKLESFYRSAKGSSRVNIPDHLFKITEKISDTINELLGEENQEAKQLKAEVDAQLLQLEKDMDNFSQEAENLKALGLNRENYLREANKLLEVQNKVLKEQLEKVNPIINKIIAIDQILVSFNNSDKQEELFAEKKAEFYEHYEPFLKEVADFEQKLFLQLKSRNSPEIDALKKELDQLVQQTLTADKKIQENTKTNLGNYNNLLNHVFELRTAEERAKSIFKKIEEKIPEQQRENQLRDEFWIKRETLLEINQTLRVSHIQFKAQEVQLDAIKFLDTAIPRFEEDLTQAPIKQIEEELEAINSTLERLTGILHRAKVTPRVAQQHFTFLCNTYRTRSDPLLTPMEQLRDAPHHRDIRLTMDFSEYTRFRETLKEADFLIAEENLDFEAWKINYLSLWSREDLVAYCKQLAKFADIALLGGIEAYSIQYNAEMVTAFEDAMAFTPHSQENPFTKFRQMSAFISVASDNTDELDRAIKSVYSSRLGLQRDFKKQYPDINIEATPTFLSELQFSEEILRQISDERLAQILTDVNNQGDLEAFLREQLDVYYYSNRNENIPSSEQFEHYNFSDLPALRSSRDFIATILKVHWLTLIQKQIEIEQAVDPKSKIMDDLLNLKQSVLSNPIYAFLSNNLSGEIENKRNIEDSASIDNRLKELKQEQIYNSFNQFYEIQTIALGHSLAKELGDLETPITDASEKLSRLQEKIKANIQSHSLDPSPTSLTRLGFPQDFYSLIQQSEDFLKWSDLLQGSLGESGAQLISKEDKQFLQAVAHPSWLMNLNEEINRIILTEPQNVEGCSNLVGRLNQCATQVEKLSEIHKKWMMMIDNVLKAYPSESKTYNPRFHQTQVDEWDHINTVINNPQVQQNLREYRANRAQLEKVKEHGFEANIDYKNLLMALTDNKLILDAGRDYYQQLENIRKEKVGESPQKLTAAIKILSQLNDGIYTTFIQSEAITEEQKTLLQTVNGKINNLSGSAKVIISDLERSYPGSQEFDTAIAEASKFLTDLPTEVSQCFNEQHFNELDEAGDDLMIQAYNKVMDAISELCEALDIEFKYERAVGKVTQDYKTRVSAITKNIIEPPEAITHNSSKK
ncbi:hypothetical protein [Legionella sp. WA2022007384]